MGDRVLKKKQVAEKTSLSPSSVDRLTKSGVLPQKRHISDDRVGWLESEIDDFISNLPRV